MKILHLSFFLTFLLSVVQAISLIPTPPTEDEFYTQPSNISGYKEGAIVKWRKAPQKIRALLTPINIKGAWQFMVRSTNSQGDAVGIVGTILEPYDADSSKLLVYNYAEDANDLNCSPSYSILFNAPVDTFVLQAESLYMNVAFTKGWYVLVTDYEGPNSSFTAARLSGMATLDAIRGALSSGSDSGINSDAEVVIWGYSGGTVPSSWAGMLLPSYAPDLSENVIGVAIGGWLTNLTRTAEKIDGTVFSGLVGAAIAGISSEYPEVQSEIKELAQPDQYYRIQALTGQCLIEEVVTNLFVCWFDGDDPVFTDGWSLFDRPEIVAMLAENTIAYNASTPVPEVPFFVYHGEPDEIVPFENSQTVYEAWCAQGVKSLEFAVSETSGHGVEFIEGGAAAIEWITERFGGKAAVSGCSRTVRKSNLEYEGADKSFYSVISTIIDGVLQKQLGPLLESGESVSAIESGVYALLVSFIEAIGVIPLKRDEIPQPESRNVINGFFN